MQFYLSERTGIFIDAPNLRDATRTLGWEADYGLLKSYFEKQTIVIRAYYFTATDETSSGQHKVLEWLAHNGFVLITKPMKGGTNNDGSAWRKGNLDVEIAVGMMRLQNMLDHFILFSGDGDFTCLVRALQELGKRVTVVSSARHENRNCSLELRKQADNFLDLDDLGKFFARDPEMRTKLALRDGPVKKVPSRAVAVSSTKD